MNPLVSTDWLGDQIGKNNLIVMDASWFMPGTTRDPRAEFVARHIPGAVFFDIERVADHATDLPHMLPDPLDFAVAARRLGVNPDSLVVVYDAIGIFSAPRVWWTFRTMGHENIAVLDGGLPKWLAESRPIEKGWREPDHGTFKSRFNAGLVRNLNQIRSLIDTRAEQIVDARPALRFTGETPEPRVGLRSGHMPGARSLPFSSLVDANGCMAPADQITSACRAAGVDLSRPIVTSCGSGISASVVALGLALIGRNDAAVYDGSWTEWAAQSDTPVIVGPE